MTDKDCRDSLILTCGRIYGWAMRLETEIGTPHAQVKDQLVQDMKEWSQGVGTALGVRLASEEQTDRRWLRIARGPGSITLKMLKGNAPE